jgi:hypothetical protein
LSVSSQAVWAWVTGSLGALWCLCLT